MVEPRSGRLIRRDCDQDSLAVLNAVYNQRLMPAEKKPFLIDLKRSQGPHLAVAASDEYILDCCSQIATIGLGLNAHPLFAPVQHLESWTGQTDTENIMAIGDAYRSLLRRLLGPGGDEYSVHFCHSGAEAIEIGLGLCFEHRPHRAARKILAFEGAYHGRTMVALSATWNAAKREPFAWLGFETEFAPYPAVPSNSIGVSTAALQLAERLALQVVQEKLASGHFFVVLIEPMQGEGGDRYSSREFHRQLIRIAQQFEVPIVYDEIQTGFGLGGTFFWHAQFFRADDAGLGDLPDVICCAKKAQVGVVLSRKPIAWRESYCPASLIRGYATASVLDQYAGQIRTIQEEVRGGLVELVSKHQALICNPRNSGLAFAFDFHDSEHLNRFVSWRFRFGLLFYPAGQRTARFRLNLSFQQTEMQLMWRQLDAGLAALVSGIISAESPRIRLDRPAQPMIDYHELLVRIKTSASQAGADQGSLAIQYLQQELVRLGYGDSLGAMLVTRANYRQFRPSILAMQQSTYEPARQTPAEEFDLLFRETDPIESPAIIVLDGDQIAAMAFCGPLCRFQMERGVADDPGLSDPGTYYMLDLTVAPAYRGGLGSVLKSAIVLLAAERGIAAIHGRNRDRLAGRMWGINLGLGSYQTRHLVDDYPDNEPYRDCLYYRLPLQWDLDPPTESEIGRGLDLSRVDRNFFRRNIGSMVNKLCLSNFVTREFIEDLAFVTKTLPQPLRHVYTSSGLSEGVDKIVKALWLKRRPRNGLLTICGHQFGQGTFLARSLSGNGEPFFPVEHLDPKRLLIELRNRLTRDEWLAFFVQTEMMSGSEDLLAECVGVCRRFDTPIVFNETGPRFGSDGQMSRREELRPDGGMAWLGGQMALTYLSDSLFVDDPLLLISTWDGDAYCLARYAETMRQRISAASRQGK